MLRRVYEVYYRFNGRRGGFAPCRAGGKTPLEYADTKAIDKLSQKSILGLCKTIPDGMTAGSDVANLSALGYDPKLCHTGRSPGGRQHWHRIAKYRYNIQMQFCYREDEENYLEKTMLDHSAGDLPTEDSAVLLEAIKPVINNDIFSIYL